MQLKDLPVETLLRIIAYLPLTQIHAVQCTCKYLDHVVRVNESSVYRMAAEEHGFVPKGLNPTTLQALRNRRQLRFDWIKVDDSWKDYCRNYRRIQTSWRKKLSVNERAFPTPQERSLRAFFVDEADGVLLTMDNEGVLTTYCMKSQQACWSRSSNAIDPRVPIGALVAFSNGYLLFAKDAHQYTLWKRDLSTSQCSAEHYERRLSFVATIQLEGTVAALSFREPQLVVATRNGALHIFDVQSEPDQDGIIVPQSTFESTMSLDDVVKSLDFDDSYIFVLSVIGIRILDIQTGQTIMRIWESQWQSVSLGKWVKGITPNTFGFDCRITVESEIITLKRSNRITTSSVKKISPTKQLSDRRKDIGLQWGSGKLVACDDQLVVGLNSNWLIYIPDYRKMLAGTRGIGEDAWVVDMEGPFYDLAFNGKRIVYHDGNNFGIFDVQTKNELGPQLLKIPSYHSDILPSPPSNPGLVLTESSLWYAAPGRNGNPFLSTDLKEWNFIPQDLKNRQFQDPESVVSE